MYVPPHARETRLEVLAEAIAEIGFGTLATVDGPPDDPRPRLTHLPMMLVAGGPFGTLIGHVASANSQHEAPLGATAVASFVGAQFYVSPSAYPTKMLTHKVVPTWDYIAVEASGRIAFVREPARLREIVEQLTGKFEAGRELPWSVDDAPEDFIDAQLRAIVGFEIRIEHLTGAYKLSRNRSDGDRAGVAALAAESSDPAVKELAERIRTRT